MSPSRPIANMYTSKRHDLGERINKQIVGSIKGSMRSRPSPPVSREHFFTDKGEILLVFSGHIGVKDSNAAEI